MTNAGSQKQMELGMVNMPYEIFTLNFSPEKSDREYYKIMLENFNLKFSDLVYFEHNKEAVDSARKNGIETFFYDKDKKDLKSLGEFLKKAL